MTHIYEIDTAGREPVIAGSRKVKPHPVYLAGFAANILAYPSTLTAESAGTKPSDVTPPQALTAPPSRVPSNPWCGPPAAIRRQRPADECCYWS